MKKVVVVLLLPLLIGCTSEVEKNKIAYLDYKNNLQEQETFNTKEEIDFNTYFNIKRENEEIVNYSIIINDPSIDMYNIKALLIHDLIQDEVYPSVGIMDKPVELLKDTEDKIELKGTIQTTEDISNVNFRLYIEYTDKDNNQNKIYYQVSKG